MGPKLSVNRMFSTVQCQNLGTVMIATCSGVSCRKPPAEGRAVSTSITMLPGGLQATWNAAGKLDTRQGMWSRQRAGVQYMHVPVCT
jgi:hypothetical protein